MTTGNRTSQKSLLRDRSTPSVVPPLASIQIVLDGGQRVAFRSGSTILVMADRFLKPDELPPADYSDPVIEAYKKDVDRTLLRENLKLTVDQRFRKFEKALRLARGLREAGERSRSKR